MNRITCLFFLALIAPFAGTQPPKVEPPIIKAPVEFPRGATRTPFAKIIEAIKTGSSGIYRATAPPPQVVTVPKRLSYWGNNQYGDCMDSETEVLTEHGWALWPEYDGKSLLGTMNQETGRLEFQAPTALIRRFHDGPMIYSNHKRIDFAVTPNHRMYHRPYVIPNKRNYQPGTAHYGAYRFRTASELPTRFSIPGTTTGFIGTTLHEIGIGDRRWNGTDFLRFLAIILSDGYAAGGETNHNRIGFCCFREDRRTMVEELAKRLGIEETSRLGVWELRDLDLADWLRANCYVGNTCRSPFKRIPDLVKIADQQQIAEFLDFFGDQTINENGTRTFCSSSKWLIDDLQELLLRTGRRGTIIPRGIREAAGRKIDGSIIKSTMPAFELYENETTQLVFTRHSDEQQLETRHYKGEVFCATVPNSTLITRRNGSILISGNCVTAESVFAMADYSTALGIEEIFITDSATISWARSHGWLNGAALLDVIQDMQKDGIKDEKGVLRKAGKPSSVDFSNEDTLKSAIAQGPVSIAIDANALPSGAGNKSGWYAFGGRSYPNTDHCVSLSGYGPTSELFKALGVSPPANAPANGYYLYTWSTIGVVDHQWLMNTCVEAWVRNPTVPDLGPVPPPPPVPSTITVALPNVTGAVGVPVKFSPTAAGGTSPYIFLFDYGDAIQDAAGTHTYKASGSYTVTVTAVDSKGGLGTGTCVAAIGTTPMPPIPPGPGPSPGGLVLTLPQSTPAGTYNLVLPGDLDEIQRRLDAIRGLTPMGK